MKNIEKIAHDNKSPIKLKVEFFLLMREYFPKENTFLEFRFEKYNNQEYKIWKRTDDKDSVFYELRDNNDEIVNENMEIFRLILDYLKEDAT